LFHRVAGQLRNGGLALGDRASLARSVMSFILTDEIAIVDMFSPNGFETIKPGAPIKLVFDDHPGHIYYVNVVNITCGVGQG
jgi:multidrug resistance efflux pump